MKKNPCYTNPRQTNARNAHWNSDGDALRRLIAQGEHQQQDFKYAITSVSKIAHSLSAFANTDGGRLLVGVRDDGRIAGVRSEEEVYMIDAAARSFCRPEAVVSMQTVHAEGHTVLIANVEPSLSRPVRAREEDGSLRAYIRIGDENIVASPIHIALWQQLGCEHDDTLQFTPRERQWLELIDEEGITLNRFCRRGGMSRRLAIDVLARWVRWDVIELQRVDNEWLLMK